MNKKHSVMNMVPGLTEPAIPKKWAQHEQRQETSANQRPFETCSIRTLAEAGAGANHLV